MIAQADSRKWMACLYNSFLFMEAKIMKMAKKLLALVLTGVMAVSMLTGCALSDKVTSEALEKALNKEQVQGTVDIDYKYDNGLNKKASKVWENEMKNKDFALSNNSPTKVTVDSKDTCTTLSSVPRTTRPSAAGSPQPRLLTRLLALLQRP